MSITVLIILIILIVFGYSTVRTVQVHRKLKRIGPEIDAWERTSRIGMARALAYKIDDPEKRQDALAIVEQAERTSRGDV